MNRVFRAAGRAGWLMVVVLLAFSGTVMAQPPAPADEAAVPATAEEMQVAWAAQISQHIKQHWKVPGDVDPAGAALVTRVRLQFDASGALTSYALSRSSQHAAFDEAALNAVALGTANAKFGPSPTHAAFSFSIDFNSKEQPR